MFESKGGVFFIGGVGFFAFAFLANVVVPMTMFEQETKPVYAVRTNAEGEQEEYGLVVENRNIQKQFEQLEKTFPDAFEEHFGERDNKRLAQALRLGRQVYMGEGCWHCHSQFVRPVSNESLRWGPVAKSEEYDNELQQPVLFGTRRVGPDLSREGGRHAHDWHAVHFFNPDWTSPGTAMPAYPWFFDGSPDKPNRRGLALIMYIQWLGSWLDEYPYYEELEDYSAED